MPELEDLEVEIWGKDTDFVLQFIQQYKKFT